METPRFIRYGDVVETVRISSAALAAIRAHAAPEPAREVCGLLFGTPGQVTVAQPAANVAADPARRFEIDPAALIAALRVERTGGARVVGHYHSHPTGSAQASARDREQAHGDGAIWLIVADGEVAAYRAEPSGLRAVALSSE